MNDANMGFNQFCGPAALSVLTGRNTDECAYAISCVNGQYKVKGVTTPDLVKAADRLGFNLRQVQIPGRSLFMVASMLSHAEGTYVVVVPKHFVVIEIAGGDIQLCDNHTKQPIKLQNSARLSQKVEQVLKAEKKPHVEPPREVSAEYKAEYRNSRIQVERDIKYSDGTSRVVIMGSIDILDRKHIQDIAFAMMRLTDDVQS